MCVGVMWFFIFFFKQKTAYEMRISGWSSDVCSSDLMVVPGKDCDEQAGVDEVAEATLMCLKSSVPAILPGIVFLSGGQSDEDATAHLEIGRASCRERGCQNV